MSSRPFQDELLLNFKTLQRGIQGTLLIVLLSSFLVFINGIQTASLVVLPFSRHGFRRTNRLCAKIWIGTCVYAAQKLNGTKLKVTGDEIPPSENAIIYANHQQMADIFVIMMFAKTKGRLGDLKWFVKDILKYVPGLGWGMLFLDCIFVKRNWAADKDKIHTTFSKFRRDQIPIWLISFVEGTRITNKKLAKSQEYSQKNGLPIFQNLLVPRTKGFIATAHGLSSHIGVIYDITLGYPHGVPSLWQIASGAVTEFHIHVKRYDLAKVLQTNNLPQWLMDRFVEKDELLSHFKQFGEFEEFCAPLDSMKTAYHQDRSFLRSGPTF